MRHTYRHCRLGFVPCAPLRRRIHGQFLEPAGEAVGGIWYAPELWLVCSIPVLDELARAGRRHMLEARS